MSTLSCAVFESFRVRFGWNPSPSRVCEAVGVGSGEPEGVLFRTGMRPASSAVGAPAFAPEPPAPMAVLEGGNEGENVEESGARVWGGMRW